MNIHVGTIAGIGGVVGEAGTLPKKAWVAPPRADLTEAEIAAWNERIATHTFRFAEGDMVDHRDGRMPSVVFWRSLSNKGHELYGVSVVNPEDPNPHRYILGEALVAA